MDIHLNHKQKILWKTQIRALIKQSGQSQQEIAYEMAKIVSLSTQTDVVPTAFIASLSRFVNGKGTAFPSWFELEEERLLPLAHAMKLSSTQPLWDIINSLTESPTQVHRHHPAFPNISLQFSSCIQGEKLVDYLVKLPKNRRIWIVAEKFQQIDLSDLMKQGYQIQWCTIAPQIDFMDMLVEVDELQIHDIQLLIAQILEQEELDTSARLALQHFQSQISSKNVLDIWGLDHSIENTLWVLYDLIHVGLDSTQGLLQRYRHRCFDQFCPSQMSVQRWRELFMALWMGGLVQGLELQQISQILEPFTQENLQPSNIKNVGQWLAQTQSTSKQVRQEALEALEKFLNPLDGATLLHHLSTQFFYQDQGKFYPKSLRSWTILAGMESISQQQCFVPNSQFLLHIEWANWLWVYAKCGGAWMSVQQHFQNLPSWMFFDLDRSAIFWSAFRSTKEMPKDFLQAWTNTVWIESLSLLPIKTSFVELSMRAVLEHLSFHFVHVLPKVKDWHDLQQRVSPKILRLAALQQVSPIWQLERLAPYQILPTTLAEWKTQQQKYGFEVWKVLNVHVQLGCQSSAILLGVAEGSHDPIWKDVPLDVRLQAICKCPRNANTLYAFQLLLIDHWDLQPEFHNDFLQTAEKIGFDDVLNWMGAWLSPLFIIQHMNSQHLGEHLAKCAMDFAVHFKMPKLLEQWLRDCWEWLIDSQSIQGRFVLYQGRRIAIQSIEPLVAYDAIAQVLWQGIQQLLVLDQKALLYLVYHFQWTASNEGLDKSIEYLQKNAKDVLIQRHDMVVFEAWLHNAPLQDLAIEKELLHHSELLFTLWKMDLQVQRRVELLKIAALQQPVPHWAIAMARKQLQQYQIWPEWLSPSSPSAQTLIALILDDAQGADRMWWLHTLHRSTGQFDELLDMIATWIFQPNALEWRSQTVYVLKANATPRLDSSDILRWLMEVLFVSNQVLLPVWLPNALSDLWRRTSVQTPLKIRLQIVGLLEKCRAFDVLFETKWDDWEPVLVERLFALWVQQQDISIIERYLEHPKMGHLVLAYLLSIQNQTAQNWVCQQVQEGILSILEIVFNSQQPPKWLLPALRKCIQMHPETRRRLGEHLLRHPFVWRDQQGEWLLLLRQIFLYENEI